MSPQKRKVRVPFRKNRGNKKRTQKIDHNLDDQQLEALASDERMSGKGSQSRHRTIIESEEDNSNYIPGIVLQAIGANGCLVETDDKQQYECTVRKVLRDMARDSRNAVVAGDKVFIQPSDDLQGVIEKVQPREGILSRTSQNKEHIIAANVDHVIIVASAEDPPLKPNLIDRFLVTIEKNQLKATVCVNKIDLANQTAIQPIIGQYARLGYRIITTSATSQIGIESLRGILKDQKTVFTGQSGVGKSSLLNAIQPGLGLRTAGVSEDSGKGRHTTRTTVLLPLDEGGWLIDTPGIRQLDLWDVIPEEVEGYFVEFRPYVPNCKFPDCGHTHEQSCGVKSAVENGFISQLRYESYLRIFQNDS